MVDDVEEVLTVVAEQFDGVDDGSSRGGVLDIAEVLDEVQPEAELVAN